MRTKRMRVPICLALMLFLGCSSSRDYGTATFPVTGTVVVDGEPVAGVSVKLHHQTQPDSENLTTSTAFTDADGTFAISTFEQGDGAPAGEYTVTFEWGEYNVISRAMGPDKLKGKYSDPKKSGHNVTVTAGTPSDMGRINLTTK